jgi:hypothetical protein
MVLTAGVVIGTSLREGSRDRLEGPTWLAEELNLSPGQQERMKEIWSGVREKTRGYDSEARKELADERDRAIRDLLTEEQVPKFEEIQADYDREREKLHEAWKAPFEEAMLKTREILSEEQLPKFEQLREKRWKNGRGNHRGKPDREDETKDTEDRSK